METEQRKSPWKLRYRQPAAVWEEALPLGNGHMGGLWYSAVPPES
ncbi:glycoside hydrolase N-terminal domain-containing protein [Paenibacillus rhizoplanae]